MTIDSKKKPKIIISGGGTMGSVTPLLVLADELKTRYDFVFVGTRRGVERGVISKIPYLKYRALTSGKWRRYFSLANLRDFFKIIWAFFQALNLLKAERPELIISAGAFVSVPLVWAAGFLKIPVLIHQQDIRPGLANRVMARGAARVTVTFEKSLADYGSKALWVGNPFQNISPLERERIISAFRLKDDLPLVLALGGGTGSQSLNCLVSNSLEYLSEFSQIVHLTGHNKQVNQSLLHNYQSYEFLEHSKLLALMARADLVISRAGLSVLTELAALGKPTILIPLPNSHQEDNAEYFEAKGAAVVLRNGDLKPATLVETIKEIFCDKSLKNNLSQNIKAALPQGATEALKLIIISLIENPTERAKKA